MGVIKAYIYLHLIGKHAIVLCKESLWILLEVLV